MSHDGNFYLHVFRVEEGLGNAVLVVLPDGRRGIVDWGTQEPAAIEKALQLAPDGFAFVAATHAHADHVLGLERLIEACVERNRKIGYVAFPATTNHKADCPLTLALRRALHLGIKLSRVDLKDYEGTAWKPGLLVHDHDLTWSVAVLAPSCSVVASAEIAGLERGIVPGNETSLVLLLRFHAPGDGPGMGQVLLPGDATMSTLRQAREAGARLELSLDNQALLVPHHGSSNNLPGWLVDVSHGVAVVSGREDSDHHPSADSLARLGTRCRDADGSRLYCTSYARACRTTFGARAVAEDRSWTEPGPCFGDLTIRVSPRAPAAVVGTSAQGAHRRRFGYCGSHL